MPYITPTERLRYDTECDALIATLAREHWKSGHIHYILARIVWAAAGNSRTYTNLSRVGGVVADLRDEFYRRQLAAYENEKREANGDISDDSPIPSIL